MNNVNKDVQKNNEIMLAKKNIFKNYNSFIYPNPKIFSSDKNDIKMIKENSYINIDANANLNKIKKDDLEKINKKIEEFNDAKPQVYKDEDGNIIKDVVMYIMAQFLSKLYPKCPINIGNISLLISKEYYLKNNISNKSEIKIEENINYFFKSRYEYKYSKILKFNKTFFQNCGKILINIYSKIKLENIAK